MIMTILQILWIVFSYVVALHWFLVSVFILLGVVGARFYRPKTTSKKARNVELIIVSKASKSVEGVLFNCIDYHSQKFKDYTIDVVIDEGSEIHKELEDHITQYKNVNLYVVPKGFKANAIAKGRAIHHHIVNKPLESGKWYVFIDDDNLIMDDKFMYEIPYYERMGYDAANGILHARYSGNGITYVADALRYFDDLTIFRFLTGVLHRPLNGFHGELMIVKGATLKKIGFDRETITEDFAFAREVDRHEHKVWQSQTMTSVLSPHSITDFIKQRNRWYRGISNDVWKGTHRMKFVAGIRTLDLTIAIIGSWIIFPLWFFMPIPLWLIAFNMIGAVYYWIAYAYGAFKLNKTIKWGILYVFLAPLYSVMETIVPHYSSSKTHFTVIHKDEAVANASKDDKRWKK